MGRFKGDLERTGHNYITIKMRLTQLLRKQQPFPYTRGAIFMSTDLNHFFGGLYTKGLFLSFVFGGIPVFFAMRKIEIAYHEKCKQKEIDTHNAEHEQAIRKAVPEGWGINQISFCSDKVN